MAGGATYVNNLDVIDWNNEIYHGPAHVMRYGVSNDRLRVFDLATGETIALIDSSLPYRWYWSHQHLHVAPTWWMEGTR